MATAATQQPAEPAGPSQQPSASANGTPTASSTDSRKISTADIQLVQNLIERCLQLYMSQREVVFTLSQQAKIETGFTLLVWQKLEEQNPDFFRAYYTRLKLKDQIVLFNHLLEQQVQMFHKVQQGWFQPPGVPAMAARPGLQLPGVPALRPGGSNTTPQAVPLSTQPALASSSAATSAPAPTSMPPQVKLEPTSMDTSPALQRSSADPATNALEVAGLSDSDFAGMATSLSELQDVPGGALNFAVSQALPLSNSELNLANMHAWSSPARGTIGLGDTIGDLIGIPRNFSLSDLALDQLGSDSEPMGLHNMLPQDELTLDDLADADVKPDIDAMQTG